MSLRVKIQKEIQKALKGKEAEKVAVLRFLYAQIQNKEIDKKRQELTDEEVFGLIISQLKKLKESLALFEKGKREDLIEKTKTEIEILSVYLPKQLSDQELVTPAL